VALLLNRDTLLIVDSSNPAALQAAAAIASTTMQEPRPYSAFPLVLRDGRWEDFQLNEFHPAFNDFRHLLIYGAADIYGRQKDLLELFYEKTKQDLFVATCVVLQDPVSEELFSFATWTSGVDTLLPASEYLVLIQPDQPESVRTKRCKFERALQVVPHLLEATGQYPARYRVKGFPTPDELNLLAEES
jgi:hypothetical protein